jgi:hypothetical protein
MGFRVHSSEVGVMEIIGAVVLLAIVFLSMMFAFVVTKRKEKQVSNPYAEVDGDIRVITHPTDKRIPVGFGVYVNNCLVARLPPKRVMAACLTFTDMIRAHQEKNGKP